MKIIRAHLVLVEQHVGNQRWHCVLSWDPAHPWHTDLIFPGPSRTTWRFARGVWADGLTGPTWGAEGDVMIEPLADGDLHVWLRGFVQDPEDPLDEGEDTEIDFVTSRALVARFIRDTHEMVPVGREPLPVSVDDLLAELLGGRHQP